MLSFLPHNPQGLVICCTSDRKIEQYRGKCSAFHRYLPSPILSFLMKEALEQPEKSPRELAFHITDTRAPDIADDKQV